MNTREFYDKNGYIILKNVFSREEIEIFNNEILLYTRRHKTIKNAGGITIPDFIKQHDLQKTASIKDNSKIHNTLNEIFNGSDYRFCSHNDIGINRIVGWHKDKLNGEVAKYETIDIWSNYEGEKHEIVKVLVYLQDHSNNNDGLKIVPGSQNIRQIKTNGSIQLRPSLGDVVIFDQRITHRGMDKQVKDSRILVSFGFGKNNIFTDNFEKGTIVRQNKQNNICEYNYNDTKSSTYLCL